MDALAHVAAIGIAAEPYRWAELEQLVYSPSRWERRLAASTIATLPARGPRRRRATPAIPPARCAILGDLIGDAEPDVQKALSWALPRDCASVDLAATVEVLRARRAPPRPPTTATAPGSSATAWPSSPRPSRTSCEPSLDGIRRRPGAPSTSRAAATAADFLSLGLAVPPAERPIIDRT